MLGISSNYYDLYVFDLLWKDDLIDRSKAAVVFAKLASVNFNQKDEKMKSDTP